MKKLLLTGVSFAALIAGPAMGADLGRPVYRAPVAAIVPVYSWTGCYAGGNAGWIGSKSDYSLAPTGSYLNAPGGAAPPNGAGTGDFLVNVAALSHSYSNTQSGGLIGVQAGCNYQFGQIVVGAEADWQWTNARNSATTSFGAFPNLGNPAFTNAGHSEDVSSRLRWFSTIRGRAGYAWDRVLLYVTGGLVIANRESDTNVGFGTFPVLPVYNGAVHVGSDSSTRTTWVIGGGAEYAFMYNWTLKAEYLYFDLRSHDYLSPLVAAVPPAAVGPGYAWYTTAHEREQLVRIGLNYKFNYAAAPAVYK